MKKAIRTLVLPLILTASLMLSSCGIIMINRLPNKDAESTADVTDASYVTEPAAFETVAPDYLDLVTSFLNKLPHADYGGTTFMIVTPSSDDLFIPTDSRPSVSEETTVRREAVEEMYNVSIDCSLRDKDTIYNEVSASMKSGDYYADLLMLPYGDIGGYLAADLLMNLNSLPGVDFTKPYFSQTGVAAASGENYTYAVAGASSLDADTLAAVWFNRDIVESAGLESPYELVRRGEWTWDKFFEYTDAAAGVDGIYAYATQNLSEQLPDLAFISSGQSFIEAGAQVTPHIAYSGESAAAATGVMQRLWSDGGRYPNSAEALTAFTSGKSMFLIERLGMMKTLSTVPVKWGVLPLPKGSADGAYRTLASGDALMFTSLTTNTSFEKIANILSALNAAAYGGARDSFAAQCMNYYLGDNASVEMVGIIYDSAVYDMAYTLGAANLSISNATYFAARNNAANTGALDRYLAMHQNNANRVLTQFFPAT